MCVLASSLRSPCVPQILRDRERERELTAQQHLFPDFAQMRAHIVTVINNRTRCPAPMMMGNLNDEASNLDAGSEEFLESEDGELYRLEIKNGKKVFTKSRHDLSKSNTKGGGKGRTDKECFRCGRIGHIRAATLSPWRTQRPRAVLFLRLRAFSQQAKASSTLEEGFVEHARVQPRGLQKKQLWLKGR